MLAVVNYDADGKFTTFMDNFKNINKVAKDTEEFKNKLLALNEAGVLNGRSVQGLIKQYDNLDKNVLDTANSFALGKKKITDVDDVIKSATTATSKFGATLKTVAANMAIMLIIDLAIKGLAKAWDTLNVTVEEQQQRVDELKSSYEGL